MGRDRWQQWPETVGAAVERQCRRVAAERVAVRFEHCSPGLHGGPSVRHAIHAYPAEDGGVAVFYRDVTPEKDATAERERLLTSERAARADAGRAVAALAESEARFHHLACTTR